MRNRQNIIKPTITPSESNQATYCPEDNKLRLYVGRVPRDEYEFLRAQGWTSTPKQSCDFVAVWTPGREDTALEYAGYIGDEDQSPEDRAADRAERFGDYRDKRADEAGAAADTYDEGPGVIGCQSQARADRIARKQDRFRTYAVTQWSKAEYWQQRTEGVISHALHKAAASVRRGRILVLEAELRGSEKNLEECRANWQTWKAIEAMTDPVEQNKKALYNANYGGGVWNYQHPRPRPERYEGGTSLYSLMTEQWDPLTGAEAAALYMDGQHPDGPGYAGGKWSREIEHLKNRLSYERQMLAAEGGTAAAADMVPGGFIGKWQIVAVNRSPVTKAVVSVKMYAPRRYHYGEGEAPIVLQSYNIQRLPEGAYRAPTAEEVEAFNQAQKDRKTATKKAKEANPDPKLINPTKEDAERLQAALNAAYTKAKPSSVCYLTQEQYTARSTGGRAYYETKFLTEKEELHNHDRHMRGGRPVCKLRTAPGDGDSFGWRPDRVVVITDKPQKPLPWDTMAAIKAGHMTETRSAAAFPEMMEGWHKSGGWLDRVDAETKLLIEEAEYNGLLNISSMTQIPFTEKGAAYIYAARAAAQEAAK